MVERGKGLLACDEPPHVLLRASPDGDLELTQVINDVGQRVLDCSGRGRSEQALELELEVFRGFFRLGLSEAVGSFGRLRLGRGGLSEALGTLGRSAAIGGFELDFLAKADALAARLGVDASDGGPLS